MVIVNSSQSKKIQPVFNKLLPLEPWALQDYFLLQSIFQQALKFGASCLKLKYIYCWYNDLGKKCYQKSPFQIILYI